MIALARLLLVVLLLVGCSSGSPSAASSLGQLMIATELPLTGNFSADGISLEHAVELAVRKHGKVGGFTVAVQSFDDSLAGTLSPARAEQNVRQMVDDARVLGVVGPYNSIIAYTELPIANPAGLAIVSPGNTSPCLTIADANCAVSPAALRPSGRNTYFRIVAADTLQGTAMADFAVHNLGLRKVAVFTDSLPYGVGLADTFTAALVRLGGEVSVRQDFDMRTASDFRAFLATARERGAEGVFAGASSNTKGCLVRAQMQQIFPASAYFIGPDALHNDQCLHDAGAGANDHMYVAAAAADARQSSDAAVRRLVNEYVSAYPHDQITPYTFAAYDCAQLLMDAITRAFDANGGRIPRRWQVVEALARTNQFRGTTGIFSFDANGDPKAPVVSLFRVEQGRWSFVRFYAFKND